MYEPLPTPLADHMTADLPIVADFTAIDGTTYHRLELIIKRKQGSASVYCLERDWQQTTAAHLAYQMTLNEALIDQVNILAERSERLARELERLHGWRRTMILGLTADARQEQINEGQAAGMDDCLFKPVGLEALDQLVGLAMRGAPGGRPCFKRPDRAGRSAPASRRSARPCARPRPA